MKVPEKIRVTQRRLNYCLGVTKNLGTIRPKKEPETM